MTLPDRVTFPQHMVCLIVFGRSMVYFSCVMLQTVVGKNRATEFGIVLLDALTQLLMMFCQSDVHPRVIRLHLVVDPGSAYGEWKFGWNYL